MAKQTVTVTPSFIKAGRKRSFSSCPIAKAIRALGFKGVLVGTEEVTTKVKGENKYYKLPKKAQSFINRFDNGKPVKPFSFVLRAA